MTGHSKLEEHLGEGPITGRHILIVLICFCMNIADGFDVFAMSYAAPAVIADLSIDATSLGVVFSAALMGMAAGSFILAPFADRFGRRKLLLLSLAITSAAMFATSQAQTVSQLAAWRFVTGAGIGCIMPAVIPLVTEIMPKRLKNLAALFVVAGYGVGSVIAGPVAGQMIPATGWQGPFLAGGAITTLLLVITFVFVPESITFTARNAGGTNGLERVNRLLRRFGRQPLQSLSPLDEEKTSARSSPATLFGAKLIRTTVLLWLTAFFLYWTAYFLPNWTPTLFVKSGLSQSAGINALTVFAIGAVIGSLGLSLISAIFDVSKILIASLIAYAVVLGCVVFLRTDTLSTLNILIFFCGIFAAGTNGLYAVLHAAYPAELRSTAIGWGSGAGRIGAILSPLVAGTLVDEGWSMYSLFGFIVIPPLLGAALLLGIWRFLQANRTQEAAS